MKFLSAHLMTAFKSFEAGVLSFPLLFAYGKGV